MASIIPIFDQIFFNSGTTTTKDDWFDISGAIPAGQQIWLGFATMISEDKSLIFEIRVNLPGKSLGNITDTQIRAFTSVSAADSKDIDMYFGGAIATLAPITNTSTGVERVWLRIRSNSVATGLWNSIIFYSIY